MATLYETLGSKTPAYGTKERTALATAAGISNYTGTASQNAQIVASLNKASPAPSGGGGGSSPAITVPAYGSVNPDGSINRFDPNTGLSTAPNNGSLGRTYGDTAGQQFYNQAQAERSNIILASNLGTDERNQKFNLPTPIVTPIPTITPPPLTTIDQQYAESEARSQKNQNDYLAGLLSDFQNKPTGAGIDAKLQQELGIKQKQEAVNNYTTQLNQIVTRGQAATESLYGRGEGVPLAIIGGQQAEIARETAIQALPVQAQLSAAQGNLEMANQSLDRLFKIYSEDATNEFNYRTAVRKSVYDFATANEKQKLEKLDKLEERAYNEQQALIKEQSDYAKMALANNQGSLFTKISSLDPKSPTYRQDLANLSGKIYDPVKALDLELKKLEKEIKVKELSGKGSSKLLSVAEAQAAGVPFGTTEAQLIASGGVAPFDATKAQASIANLSWLTDTAKTAYTLGDASGRSGARQWLGKTFKGATPSQQLENLSTSLKTNILTLSTDPAIKKFFGPQMSEADVRMMMSGGTTLNPDEQTPAQYKAEVARVYDMFNRAKIAVEQGVSEYTTQQYFNSTGSALQVINSPFYK